MLMVFWIFFSSRPLSNLAHAQVAKNLASIVALNTNSAGEENAVIAIETSQPVQYTAFKLLDPLRLILDFPNMEIGDLSEIIQVKKGLVDTIPTRTSEPPEGQTANQGLHTIAKDVSLANAMAQNLSVPLVVGSAALQPFLTGLANGWEDKEHWVIMEFFEQMSGVSVRSPELTNL